ncbi:three-helix bundle dimerization domain-containing protein [Agromyces arachidis]|uniref:three-helix bundle dimerization domain-containing protein n=1 Tax=Agromyces arachidis TaxID=766966 RepID=UPI00405635B7
MDAHEERALVARIPERLAPHFPDLSLERIEAVVEEEYRRFDGRPIRDFVPVLTEHQSRDRLRAEGTPEVFASPPDAAPEDPDGGDGPGRDAAPGGGASGSIGPRAGETRPEAATGPPVTLLNGDLGGGPA